MANDVYQPCGCAMGGHEPGVCQLPEPAPRYFPWSLAEMQEAREMERESESEATWWTEVAA